MKTLLMMFMTLLAVMAASAGSYISGRILLPEMGLMVPPYGAFFWASLFMVAAVAAVHICAAIIKAVAE